MRKNIPKNHRRRKIRKGEDLPKEKLKQPEMRIRIDKKYGYYYHSGFDKYVVFARIYVNGRFHRKNLFFYSKEDVDRLVEGTWIDY